MDSGQIKLAIFFVWIVLSGVILCTLVAPFLLSADTINDMVPRCEWKSKYNQECPLCGMTTGFIYISQGQFTQAGMANSFSLYLYSVFVVNEIAIMLVLIKKIKRRWLGLK